MGNRSHNASKLCVVLCISEDSFAWFMQVTQLKSEIQEVESEFSRLMAELKSLPPSKPAKEETGL